MRRLETIVWWFFLIWASVGIVTLSLGHVRLPVALAWADALFIVLAAVNVFFIIAKSEGFRNTVISFLIITLGSALVETCGALTGWPFGAYAYTHHLGWRVGNILPFTIPLAWWVVIGLGHALARVCFPKISRGIAALLCAIWATLFDMLLEPFAWQVKQYWIWKEGYVPWNNYLSWFLTAFLLCYLCPWKMQHYSQEKGRLAIVASLMGLTFWVGIFISILKK